MRFFLYGWRSLKIVFISQDVAFLFLKESWEMVKNPMASKGSPLHGPRIKLIDNAHKLFLETKEHVFESKEAEEHAKLLRWHLHLVYLRTCLICRIALFFNTLFWFFLQLNEIHSSKLIFSSHCVSYSQDINCYQIIIFTLFELFLCCLKSKFYFLHHVNYNFWAHDHRMQQELEASTKQPIFVDSSVIDTIRTCIVLGNHRAALKVKTEFKVCKCCYSSFPLFYMYNEVWKWKMFRSFSAFWFVSNADKLCTLHITLILKFLSCSGFREAVVLA